MERHQLGLEPNTGQCLKMLMLLTLSLLIIATDPHYDSRVIEQIVSSLSQQSSPDLELLNEYDVIQMLSKVKKTSSGYDHLPYWLFREYAGLLSSVIKHLFNNLLTTGHCPATWKRVLL
jgi:hypothetical protein